MSTLPWPAAKHFDLGQAAEEIEAEDIGFEVFHIFADVPGLKWDNSKARRLLGFTAKHRFEELWHKTGR